MELNSQQWVRMKYEKTLVAKAKDIAYGIVFSIFVATGSFYLLIEQGIATHDVSRTKVLLFCVALGALVLIGLYIGSKTNSKPLTFGERTISGITIKNAVVIKLKGQVVLVVSYPDNGQRKLIRGFTNMDLLTTELKHSHIPYTIKNGYLWYLRYSLG